jgi:hypothetical protein
MINLNISETDSHAIHEILSRRANEVASFSGEHRDTMPGSVDLALDREIVRLRALASKFPPIHQDNL